MKIDINKKYRTRDGRPVRLLCNDRKVMGGKRIVGLVDSNGYEMIMSWYQHGKSSNESTLCDLVEVQPYEGFKIDDKVLVKDNHQFEWKKRYFAGVKEDTGKPLTFADGFTSWITKDVVSWDQCIKAPLEEQE